MQRVARRLIAWVAGKFHCRILKRFKSFFLHRDAQEEVMLRFYWGLGFCARYGMLYLPRWDWADWLKRGGGFTYFIFYLSSQHIKCEKTSHCNPGTKISSNQKNKTENCGPLHQKSSIGRRRRCNCNILIGHYSIGTSKHQNKQSD